MKQFFLNNKDYTPGIIIVALIALFATLLSWSSFFEKMGISPLVIGIIIGIIITNTFERKLPKSWDSGITFSAKKILRFAIVFYGFRITFQEIIGVGMDGFLVSTIMLISTFLLGSWIGIKIFKMDRDISLLNAAGASVCGAAAVLATEPVLESEGYKAAIAVSMVVLFGTIAMFLYPVLYMGIIEHASGFLHMEPKEFGIYVGGTIHEVAQVVAVPSSIPNAPQEMSHSAVIVKMTRVMMIAPMLIVLGLWLSFKSSEKSAGGLKIVIPWFAVYFIGVAGFNSLELLPKNIVDGINLIDTFLLTMAMSALGLGTKFSKFKGLGAAPLLTALIMFIWLIFGGFVVTKMVCEIF
ncbi:MAG: YeiH family protein [Sulfurovaceae bacterium]|nr:YeiH family protein [Sulfurovaceae bacterium]MDD5548126.1 YeiH family protein [Sulfurovaceae bacterium]